jgi:alpha-glucuronidase
MNKLASILIIISLLTGSKALKADDGYQLWLKFDPIKNTRILNQYRNSITGYLIRGNSPTLQLVKEELQSGLEGLLDQSLAEVESIEGGTLIVGTYKNILEQARIDLTERMSRIGSEGFVILHAKVDKKNIIIITANNDIGVLYGTFHFLRLLQTGQDITNADIESAPQIILRMLNHWDNLDRTIERGYAGFSLWDWQKLPDYIHGYYYQYARANASIGINGTVLNSVNADPFILTPLYLEKVAALADVFRPYGIRVYLSVKFSTPIEIGGLSTADPLDSKVRNWWKSKVEEIYACIPDFGGFLVKASSEGQPGPQDYGRSHADGANMLADALKPFGGVVMWRAFVYHADIKEDRAKQAYMEFTPLDGKFRDNVLIQVKNGPIDFQPREPFHPLFGAMPQTPLMMEFQITQEYLGFSTHLVYLGTLFKECLNSDTYARGKGSTVAKVINGSLDHHSLSGIAGVANTGTVRNWTGHLFGQANWYAFGRLAWDTGLSAADIAEEWIQMTISKNPEVVEPVKKLMMDSRENTVNYMTPLGLHHLMGWNHHYGPAPWIRDKQRADWTSVYYHRADSIGIGFDRTASGSNAVSQYYPPVAQKFASLQTCPDEYLLWFHHLSWNYRMKSGKTLWEEICDHYYQGVEGVRNMEHTWNSLEGKIDEEIFEHVQSLLKIQLKEAIWWRNACVLYFQTFSKQPIPQELEKPDQTLEYYQNLSFPYAPM